MLKPFLGILLGGFLSMPCNALSEEATTQKFDLVPNKSNVTYTVHTNVIIRQNATSHELQGQAKLTGNTLQVEIKAPVKTFVSSHTVLDEDMQKVTEANKYPTIEVDATAENFSFPSNVGGEEEKQLQAKITFHGKTILQTLSVSMKRVDEKHVQTKGKFHIDLQKFGVTPPSHLGARVKNDVEISFDLLFEMKGA